MKITKKRTKNGKSPYWQLDYTLAGKRKRMSFQTEEKARRYKIKIDNIQNPVKLEELHLAEQAIALLKATDGPTKGKTILDAVKSYIEYFIETPKSKPISELTEIYLEIKKKKNIRTRSLEDLKSRLNAFAKTYGTLMAHEVTQDHLQTYLDKFDGYSYRNHRKALNGFFTYLCGENKRTPNPDPIISRNWVHFTDSPEIGEMKKTIFTIKQIKDILSHTPKDLLAYWVFSIFSGIRDKEYRRMEVENWDWIDLDNDVLKIPAIHSKTGRSRQVPIEPNFKEFIEYIKTNNLPLHPKELSKQLSKFRKTINLPKEGDVARHTAVSYTLGLRNDYIDVCQAMGNSREVIRKHYENQVTKNNTKLFWSITPTLLKLG